MGIVVVIAGLGRLLVGAVPLTLLMITVAVISLVSLVLSEPRRTHARSLVRQLTELARAITTPGPRERAD